FDEPPLQVRDRAVRIAARRWMREGCRAWLDTGRAAMRGRRRDIRRQLDLMRVRQAVKQAWRQWRLCEFVARRLHHSYEFNPHWRADRRTIDVAAPSRAAVVMLR